MTNSDLKLYAAGHGVKLWQVAKAFGMKDSNFSRMHRVEFTPDQEEKFRQIVDDLAGGKSYDDNVKTSD